MNINWSESGNSVQNGQKWPNLIAINKFFVNKLALVSYNKLKFVDKMDNILSLMCIELNLV